MEPSVNLSGMKVLITGAGRGIGRATAQGLASKTSHLILTARTKSELESVRDEIGRNFPKLRLEIFQMDVSSEESVIKVFSQISELDALINNAGYISVRPIREMTLSEWNRNIEVNLTGAFLCSREALKKMKTGSCIINIGSLGGMQAAEKFFGFAAYSAAKAGLVALTQCLAVEGKSEGIRANLIAPGMVDTQMLREALPNAKTTTKPEDIAEEIQYFLLDPEGRQLTGYMKELKNV